MNRFSRIAAAGIVTLMALTLPRVGLTDVAPPMGTYTLAEDETCPAPEDLELADLELETYGCTAVSVGDLFDQSATSCFYSLVTDCSDVDDGGC